MNLIRNLYSNHIFRKGREAFLFSLFSFWLTVVISRLIALDVEKGKGFFTYLYIRGYHIHHFYYGILILIISNWLALIRYKRLYRRVSRAIAGFLFGAGLGFVTDEFGLLLTMEFGIKGNYWASQSYWAIGAASLVLLICFIFAKVD